MEIIWKFLMDILDFFSIFNKITGLVLFLVSIFLFIRFFGFRYKKPILFIFKKNNFFALFLMSKISISFRKNPKILTRMFCEYLIAQNYNKKLTTKDLRIHHKNFIQRYVKKDYDSIDIKSTFDAKEIFDCPYMKRYFTFYNNPKNQKLYDIDTRKVLSFVLPLNIEKGYLLPAILLPGLQGHYNDDWSSISNRYLQNAKTSSNTSELFMFYTWLMWGPSYMPKYRRRDYKLMQYGMGDESKTFNVVLNSSESSVKLWDQITDSIKNYGYGLQCGLRLSVNEKNAYIETNTNMFGNEVSPFINKMLESNTSIILEYIDRFVPVSATGDFKYFSAYIWVLFIKTETPITGENFGINNCVAFFEHANIAENTNYTFLLNSMIQKILLHFENNYQYCSSKYFLNNALSEDVYDKVKIAIDDRANINDAFGKWLKESIILENVITIGALLDRFDEEFSMSKQPLSFHEIKIDFEPSLELLSRFYVSIYLPNFPNENERETLDNFIRYLNNEKNGVNGKNHYHILIATIQGEIAGGIIGDYFAEINSGVFEFIVVNEKYRRNQVGARLIEEMTNIFNNDAKKYQKGKVDYIFIETENPFEISVEIREKALQTLEFWRRQRFFALDFKYIQPSIDSGKQPVEHLFLAVKICRSDLNEDKLDKDILKQFLSFYAKYAMSIKVPEQDEAIIKNYRNVNNKDIKLKYIDDFLENSSISKKKKDIS